MALFPSQQHADESGISFDSDLSRSRCRHSPLRLYHSTTLTALGSVMVVLHLLLRPSLIRAAEVESPKRKREKRSGDERFVEPEDAIAVVSAMILAMLSGIKHKSSEIRRISIARQGLEPPARPAWTMAVPCP